MRIGTTIILIVVILISFGYVLSDDQNVRKSLAMASQEVESLKLQLDQANQKMNSCQEAVQNNIQTISQQETEIASLNNTISIKDNEIGSLKSVVSQQTGGIVKLEDKLAKLENVKVQVDQTTNASPNTSPLIAAVFLITQVALAVVQKKRKMKMGFQLPLSKQQEKSQYIRLTTEELAKIVSMRRMRKL